MLAIKRNVSLDQGSSGQRPSKADQEGHTARDRSSGGGVGADLGAVRGGLEAGGEGPRGDEPGAEVVLERELHGAGLRRRRAAVPGPSAGGGDRRRRGRGRPWRGAGARALELVVVVEEQLVGLEGGGGGEGEGEGEEEEEGEEARAARRGHGFWSAEGGRRGVEVEEIADPCGKKVVFGLLVGVDFWMGRDGPGWVGSGFGLIGSVSERWTHHYSSIFFFEGGEQTN